MFLRNYKGEIIFFDINEYKNEKDMYQDLWYQMYKIHITEDDKNNANLKDRIIEYIKSPKNMYNL
tara:strand:- start:23 stop:217 length:195 start_codon:yes stop_codon:yes gene_type:complete